MSSSSGSDERLDFAPVVLIEGPEATLREAALAELRERVLAGALRDFNEDRFDLSTAGVDPLAIIAAARTLPVMARARLVRVRGVGEKRAEKFLDGALVEYLEAPVATTCLVLEAEGVDKRQKWVKRVAKIGQVIECAGPSRPADVRRWIEARMSQRGMRAGHGVAATLFDLVGPDLDRLALEEALDVTFDVSVRRSSSGELLYAHPDFHIHEVFLSSADPQVYASNKEQALRRVSSEIAERVHDELFQRF